MAQLKRIALIMGQDLGYCREVMRGVQRFCNQHGNWIFHDSPPVTQIIRPLREWQPHGVIAHLFDRGLAHRLRSLNVPIVNVTSTLTNLQIPIVEVDHEAVGRMAAEHFIEKGFRYFGYFGSGTAGFSVSRERGYGQTLRRAGHAYSDCHAEYLPRPAPAESWTEVDQRVRQWVMSLPKPVGIFASNDVPARDLARICQTLKLKVPGDVSILGVDNDEVETGLSFPPLSSIALPADRIGFEAALLLDEMIRHPRRSVKSIYLPPQGVVVRESTDIVAINDPELAAMLDYIRQHATERIGVGDVLNFANVSRRKGERRFRKSMNRTIHDEIRRVRLERAKRLLASTDWSIEAVANKSGFEGARRFAVVFKQQTRTTPTAYRRQFRLFESCRETNRK